MKNIILTSLIIILGFASANSQELYKNINSSNFRDKKIFQQTIDTANFQANILNAAIFHLTNEIRLRKRLSELRFNKKLEESATTHSKDMAELNFFSHTNFKIEKHKEPKDRAKLAGIANPYIAENIIEGFVLVYTSGMPVVIESPGMFSDPKTKSHLPFHSYLSLAEVMIDNWMHSKGHRANILSKDAIELGCGTYMYYMHNFNNMPVVKATQNFQHFEPIRIE